MSTTNLKKLLKTKKYYAIIISYLRSTPKRQYNKKRVRKLVRTITTTVMTLYYKEQGSDEIKTATREFVGTSWTQTKMYNDMKKDEVLIPSGATVENITTETKFCTYHLSDENFIKAAIAELEVSGGVSTEPPKM
jgi:hypothetical protein